MTHMLEWGEGGGGVRKWGEGGRGGGEGGKGGGEGGGGGAMQGMQTYRGRKEGRRGSGDKESEMCQGNSEQTHH